MTLHLSILSGMPLLVRRTKSWPSYLIIFRKINNSFICYLICSLLLYTSIISNSQAFFLTVGFVSNRIISLLKHVLSALLGGGRHAVEVKEKLGIDCVTFWVSMIIFFSCHVTCFSRRQLYLETWLHSGSLLPRWSCRFLTA